MDTLIAKGRNVATADRRTPDEIDSSSAARSFIPLSDLAGLARCWPATAPTGAMLNVPAAWNFRRSFTSCTNALSL
jgi:hypothetical protein